MMKKIRVLCVCFILFKQLFPSSAFAESPDTLLSVGEQRSIETGSGARFSVGNPEVIQVKSTQGAQPGKAFLLVKAKSLGYSDLLIFDSAGGQKKHSFRIVTKRQGGSAHDISSSLSNVSGIRVTPEGDSLVIRGEIDRVDDHNLVQALKDQSKGRLVNLSTVSARARNQAVGQIKALFKEAGWGDSILVRGVGSQIWLEGELQSKTMKDRAELLAKDSFYNVQSYIKLPFDGKDVLRFKVQILELSKTGQNQSGLQWSDGIPGILQLHQKLLKGNISLEASLGLLEKKGMAKILSQPQIALNAEGVAELKVGGEIPIPTRSKNFSTVQWKPYGLLLRLDVPGAGTKLARTNVNVELTTLDRTNGIDGIPATKVNRMQTVVDLMMGKTIFLSGLLQDNVSENVSSFPILGDIPILGALFRSKEYQSGRSELVIAITAIRENYAAR